MRRFRKQVGEFFLAPVIVLILLLALTFASAGFVVGWTKAWWHHFTGEE